MSSRSSTTSEADLKAQLFEAYERLNPQPEPRRLWLQWLMLVTLVAVLIFSIVGFVVSGIVLGGTTDMAGVALGQAFVLFASLLAITYIVLHVLNARRDYPMDRKQAYQHPLQSWAIIVARIDVITWAIALIASSVILAKTGPKQAANLKAIQANVVACVAGLPAMGIVLTVCETARYPFTLPWITPDAVITCRISALEYDMFDDSVSRRGSIRRSEATKEKIIGPRGPRPIREQAEEEAEEAPRRAPSVKKEPKTRTWREALLGPRAMPEPVEEEEEEEEMRQEKVEVVVQQPPQPQPVHHRQPDWKSQWSQLAEETGYNSIPSSPSLSQHSAPWQPQQPSPALTPRRSSSSLKHKSRGGPLRRPSKIGRSSQQGPPQPQVQYQPQPQPQPQPARSTVSNASSSAYSHPARPRRSPLSVMRTADDPNTAIESDIRVVKRAGSSTYTTMSSSSGSGGSWQRSETMSSAGGSSATRPSTADSVGSAGLFSRAAERLKAQELDSKAIGGMEQRPALRRQDGGAWPPAPTVEDETVVRIPGSFVE